MKRGKATKVPVCPHCGSPKVIPVVYGIPSPRIEKALKRGQAIMADCEEWEGQPQWHCKECGCEWRGSWMRFKKR